MRCFLLPVLAVLALGLLGWWFLGARSGPASEEAEVDRRAPTPDDASMLAMEDGAEAPTDPRLTGSGVDTADQPTVEGAVIVCRVLDPEGKARPRSVVRLVALVPGTLPPEHRSPNHEDGRILRFLERERRSTDVQGVVRFAGLAPGTYRLEALAPAGFLAPHAAVEVDRADVEVDLAYRRAVSARIEVLDPEGAPVPGATVSIDRMHAPGKITTERGLCLLAELDPTWDVALVVRPPRGVDLFESRIDPWTVGDTRVVLPRSHALAVRVVDEEGHPVSKARIRRQGEGDSARIYTTDEEGRYRFTGLQEGEALSLRAAPPGTWTGTPTEPTTARAGDSEVVFVLVSGATLEVVVRGWPEGEGGKLTLTTTSAKPIIHEAVLDCMGRAVFTYLSPGELHVLWGVAAGDAKERFVYREGVLASDEPLEVELQQGEPIYVTVEVPEGVGLRSVSASRPGVYRRAWLMQLEVGTIRIPGLPPGPWTVQALGVTVGVDVKTVVSWVGEAVAEPGDRVELTLERYED